jgi:hypothetical protein
LQAKSSRENRCEFRKIDPAVSDGVAVELFEKHWPENWGKRNAVDYCADAQKRRFATMVKLSIKGC